MYKGRNGTPGHFYNSIRKDGWNNFKAEILEESNDIEYARDVLEPYYIKFYKSLSIENGYNMTLGGGGIFGWNHSEKTKLKMSKPKPPKDILVELYSIQRLKIAKIAKMFKVSPITVRKWLRSYEILIVNTQKGSHLSEEWKANISKSHAGVHLSEEHKIALSKPKPIKDVLIDLYSTKKLGSNKIGKMFEVSPQTVLRWFRSYGIPIGGTKNGKHLSEKHKASLSKPKPPKYILVDLYSVKRFGGTKIGRMFKVSPSTVCKWLKSYEIPVRKSRKP
jgi:transposase